MQESVVMDDQMPAPSKASGNDVVMHAIGAGKMGIASLADWSVYGLTYVDLCMQSRSPRTRVTPVAVGRRHLISFAI